VCVRCRVLDEPRRDERRQEGGEAQTRGGTAKPRRGKRGPATHLLGLHGGVDVVHVPRLEVAGLVVEDGVDDAVVDGLGANELRRGGAVCRAGAGKGGKRRS